MPGSGFSACAGLWHSCHHHALGAFALGAVSTFEFANVRNRALRQASLLLFRSSQNQSHEADEGYESDESDSVIMRKFTLRLVRHGRWRTLVMEASKDFDKFALSNAALPDSFWAVRLAAKEAAKADH